MEKMKIYLDDVRTPVDNSWIVVRDYYQFVDKVNELGFENIELVSLDHDLGDSAMAEWYNNVYLNNELNYDNITEKTGYDCAKWLVDRWMEGNTIFDVYTHSTNVVGAKNIVELVNSYRRFNNIPETAKSVNILHKTAKSVNILHTVKYNPAF